MAIANENSQMWESVYARMPELLKKLKTSDLLQRDGRGNLPEVPDRGIYVFYEHPQIARA